MNKLKKAFTLIELLVVIAIIAVLATLAVVALQNSRASARDAKRLADVKQMQTALELYFNDNGSYPTSLTSTIATSGIVYMATIPTSPTPVDGDCTTENNSYIYSSNGSTYSINFCLGKQTAGLSSGVKTLTRDGVSVPAPWACGDIFTDPRDFQQYPTVQIGTQCWMAKNMNYDNGCASNIWVNSTDTKWCGCYNNDNNNCIIYGKLYQWSAAMNSSIVSGAQGICPSGWHVPTATQFTDMATYLSGVVYGGGEKIKQAGTSNWLSPNSGATNSSGFTALPAGNRVGSNGSFGGVNSFSNFWTSSKYSSSNATINNLSYDSSNFPQYTESFHYGFSVRCLKD